MGKGYYLLIAAVLGAASSTLARADESIVGWWSIMYLPTQNGNSMREVMEIRPDGTIVKGLCILHYPRGEECGGRAWVEITTRYILQGNIIRLPEEGPSSINEIYVERYSTGNLARPYGRTLHFGHQPNYSKSYNEMPVAPGWGPRAGPN